MILLRKLGRLRGREERAWRAMVSTFPLAVILKPKDFRSENPRHVALKPHAGISASLRMTRQEKEKAESNFSIRLLKKYYPADAV